MANLFDASPATSPRDFPAVLHITARGSSQLGFFWSVTDARVQFELAQIRRGG
jgi:hypothetical protein